MMLTGNNSILNRATEAKEKNIVGTEKEAISLAYSGTQTNYIGQEVTADRLKAALEKNGNKIKNAEENGNIISIEFDETGNIYKIDKNGDFIEPVVNPYDPDDWTYAYTYAEENGWSNIIDAGNPAEGTIVAKLYKVGGQVLTGEDESLEIPEYHMVIEGTGDMGALGGYSITSANYEAWMKQRRTEATTEEDMIKNLSIEFVSQVYICDGITSVGDFAFYIEDRELEFVKFNKVIIADTVTSIGNFAFEDCTDLSNIILPNSLETIGDLAFCRCRSLTNLSIPDSVTKIGEGAFMGCSSFTSMSIPSGITEIKQSTFAGCTNLTNVSIPNTVNTIGNGAFSNSTNLDVKIPDTVTTIDTFAFKDVKHIEYHGTASGSPWGAKSIN